ncbi:hypothetical protein V8D89_004376 [Ganoderma adspersum]
MKLEVEVDNEGKGQVGKRRRWPLFGRLGVQTSSPALPQAESGFDVSTIAADTGKQFRTEPFFGLMVPEIHRRQLARAHWAEAGGWSADSSSSWHLILLCPHGAVRRGIFQSSSSDTLSYVAVYYPIENGRLLACAFRSAALDMIHLRCDGDAFMLGRSVPRLGVPMDSRTITNVEFSKTDVFAFIDGECSLPWNLTASVVILIVRCFGPLPVGLAGCWIAIATARHRLTARGQTRLSVPNGLRYNVPRFLCLIALTIHRVVGLHFQTWGCLGVASSYWSSLLSEKSTAFIVNRALAILADTTLIVITWKFLPAPAITEDAALTEARIRGKPNALASRMLRNARARSRIHAPYGLTILYFASPLSSVLVSRFLLNLQEAHQRTVAGGVTTNGSLNISRILHGSINLGDALGSIGAIVDPTADYVLEEDDGPEGVDDDHIVAAEGIRPGVESEDS